MQEQNKYRSIVIKDPHFMFGFRNNIRKAGWENDIDSKIFQVIDYALVNEIKKIQFTGDVSEKSRRRDWSLNQLQQNKKRLQYFKDADLEVISNLGNHDYFDGKEELEGTAFNEYVQSNLLIYNGTYSEPIISEFNDFDVQEFGIDYHHNKDIILDRFKKIQEYPTNKKTYKIVTIHSNITNSEEQLTDFTYQELAKFEIDVINCGHYHIQNELGACAKVGETLFINPWNFTRVSRDYNTRTDEHHPEMVHITIDSNGISSEVIKLQIKPFQEAFDIPSINLMQELGKERFSFFDEIDLDGMDNNLNDSDLIKELAKKAGFSEESAELAKELLC